MVDQSLASRVSAKLLPAASKRVFPEEWMSAGDDRLQLAAIAKKRRALDGPRPDLILQRKWRRATTLIEGRELHLLTPKGGSTGRVLFYCHGGAFVVGPSSLEWLFAAKVASALGTDLALYDYPKVPEVDATTIRPTTLAAYRAIEKRYSPQQTVMSGLSAGGGLAVATMLALQVARSDLPSSMVLFSPWLDMGVSHPDAQRYAESDHLLPIELLRRDGALYAGRDGLGDPLVSPLFASPEQLAALPKTVVTAGDEEILLPEAREFVEKLNEAGTPGTLVVEPYGQHAGIAGGHPEAKAALAECVEAMR